MLIIDSWYGRTGNNVCQMIRCIWVALHKKHCIIKFKNKHPFFNSQQIHIKDVSQNIQDQNIIQDIFFNITKYNLPDIPLYKMKDIFQKYLKPITNLNLNLNNDKTDNICIHLRGGDTFSKNPHKSYLPPPLRYYTDIIKKYNSCTMVYEDTKNICVNELKKNKKVDVFHKTLQNDIEFLCSCKELAIGFGTFGLLIYFMNINLKKIYIPDYFYNELPNKNYGTIEVNVIKLPNYIKPGSWKNTDQQRKLLLSY